MHGFASLSFSDLDRSVASPRSRVDGFVPPVFAVEGAFVEEWIRCRGLPRLDSGRLTLCLSSVRRRWKQQARPELIEYAFGKW
jgi:hypothetical protein